MAQQLLVLCGNWKFSCDQKVQAAHSPGSFVLRERIGFMEEVLVPDRTSWQTSGVTFNSFWTYGSVSKSCTPFVHIKIAGKWMFIPLKMVIGIDPYRSIPISCLMQARCGLLHHKPSAPWLSSGQTFAARHVGSCKEKGTPCGSAAIAMTSNFQPWDGYSTGKAQ